jgi:UDP-N-acetylmuramoyl-tripeptide--D-alanyl-D-alanine ligase
MPAFDPQLLAAWTGGRWTRPPEGPLTGFSADSRRLGFGQVFVALQTAQRDGHAFVSAAGRAGAGAALVADAQTGAALPQLVVADPLTALQAIAREHRRRFPGPVVGISGSAGKTSTKDLLARLLEGRPGSVLATEGNLNNHLGVPLTLLRLDPRVHAFAVIEAGISAPGEMAPLAAMIEPDVAVITLVAPAHLEALGGIEGVAREKARLPAAVRPGGRALFPASCAQFAAFRALTGRVGVLERRTGRAGSELAPAGAPGPGPSAAAGADTRAALERIGFTVTHRGDATTIALEGVAPTTDFTLRRVSDGMAQNAALAISAALGLGVPAADVAARLAGWGPAPLRGEWRQDGLRRLYVDCYNANPAAMADALTTFCAVAPAAEPRLFVLGCMEELGPDAADYHRTLGRTLPLRAGDFAVVIGTQAEAVREGAVAGGHRPDRIRIAASAGELAPIVGGFRGSVFVKGSRRYALEQALGGALGAEVLHA